MDQETLKDMLHHMKASAWFYATIFIVIQLALISLRWMLLINIGHRRMNYADSLQVTLTSLLANMLFFTSLGGVRLWKTVLTVEGHEELHTAVGKRRTVRIGGVSTRLRPSFEEDKSKQPRTFTLWVTDDDQRIPVKISAHTELGDVVAKATSYQAPEE
jgi:hypothetical protein